jgi:hypothetical protein
MGVFLQAAKRGAKVLDRLLSAGVVVVERSDGPWGKGKLGSYLIEANTPVKDCMGVFVNKGRGEHPLFEEARSSPEFKQLMASAETSAEGKAPLHQIGAFFGWLGSRLERELDRHPNCRVMYNTKVEGLSVGTDGKVCVHAASMNDGSGIDGKGGGLAFTDYAIQRQLQDRANAQKAGNHFGGEAGESSRLPYALHSLQQQNQVGFFFLLIYPPPPPSPPPLCLPSTNTNSLSLLLLLSACPYYYSTNTPSQAKLHKRTPLLADSAILALGGKARSLDVDPAGQTRRKMLTSDDVQSLPGLRKAMAILDRAGILKKKRSMMKRISRLNKEAAALETCGKRQKLLLLTPEVSAL